MVKKHHIHLDVHVKALLEGRRGDWEVIAKDAGISYSWLSKFARNLIPNPGYVTLRRLAEYLEKTAPKQRIAR